MQYIKRDRPWFSSLLNKSEVDASKYTYQKRTALQDANYKYALPGKHRKKKFICLKDEIREYSLACECLIDSGVLFFHNWYFPASSRVIISPESSFARSSKNKEKEELVEECLSLCWRELDWSRSRYDNPFETDGLLTADGRWIGCGFGGHYVTEEVLLGSSGAAFEEQERIIHFSGGQAHAVEFELTGLQVRWFKNIEKRVTALSGKIKYRALKERFIKDCVSLQKECLILLDCNEKRFQHTKPSGAARMPRIDTSNFETGLRKLPRSGD